LGAKTGDLAFHVDTSAPWILHLSRGGLMLPTEEFLEAFNGFEECFHVFHGATVDKKPDVFKRLHSMLERNFKDRWPSDVLMLYARVRTFIRIKALNSRLKLEEATRNMKQLAQHIS
jgi:hypothetical protein